MLTSLWYTFLYQPTFNALIWLYNHGTDENLGVAIILLTLIIRVALLPFSVFEILARKRNQKMAEEIAAIQKSYKNDPIMMKEEVRRHLRKRRITPWARFVVLGVQLLFLLLLYQVFMQGVSGERVLATLYPFVSVPGTINTVFLGYDISQRYNIVWPGIIFAWLFIEIYWGYHKNKQIKADVSDVTYLFLFPFFVFFLLYMLPIVKSLFVLTSMAISFVTYPVLGAFVGLFQKEPEKATPDAAKTDVKK